MGHFNPNDPLVLKMLAEARAEGRIVSESVSQPLTVFSAVKQAKPLATMPSIGELAAAEVIAWCVEQGWEVPVTEHRFHPVRKWRFDVCFLQKRIAIEFQGGIWGQGRHNRAAGFIADCEKLSTAVAMGWRVMPVAYSQFRNGMLLEWVRQVMREGAAHE